jgi:Pyruvate/2-oxoacid:ferredoxin oxidoreductase gamma subunit
VKSPYNIYITGVGGQGVVTLANSFRSLCEANSRHSTGSVIKGGAQRLGTVSATLRIFDGACTDYRDYSLDIPDGRLDLLIGLEPWEGLRAYRLCSPETTVVLNHAEVPLMVARSKPVKIKSPATEFQKLGITVQCENFTAAAIKKHGDKKMLNFEMGLSAIRTAMPDFSIEQFESCFGELVAHG